jgi:hypothetical protein
MDFHDKDRYATGRGFGGSLRSPQAAQLPHQLAEVWIHRIELTSPAGHAHSYLALINTPIIAAERQKPIDNLGLTALGRTAEYCSVSA